MVMFRLMKMLVSLLLLFGAWAAQAQTPMRILFIGNSYTYYHQMPAMVAALAAAAPGARPMTVREITVGGATLERMADMRQTRLSLEDERWDVVVLQEQSTRPLSNPERMRESILGLHKRARQAGAQLLLYMTWARSGRLQEQPAISEAYRKAALGLENTRIAPVGPAWSLAFARLPGLVLHDADGTHPNPSGSYLAACVIFLSLQSDQGDCPALSLPGLSGETRQALVVSAREAMAAELAR